MSSTAIRQLSRDLKQLEKEPIVGANAAPLEGNMLKWFGIVVGPQGTPYEGIPIHFVLEFDQDYPNSAPKAFFSHYVAYTGGASYLVAGRLAVCLNIFGNFHHVHTEWKNMQEGWSPSYSVTTILVTMQGLLMSDLLSNNSTDLMRTRSEACSFKCRECGHDGSDRQRYFPTVLMSQEEVNSYYQANGIVKEAAITVFDPLRDHYICYVTKANKLDKAVVLGYGIHLENPRNGTLSSPCEYISKSAYDSGTRNGATNKPFELWIPILTHSNEWTSIKGLFVAAMRAVASSINLGSRPIHEIVVKVCSSIMNSLVVEIMNNTNNLTANDKFIDGYFAIYRLMAQYALEVPALLTYVDYQLDQFIKNPAKRTKEFVPNLGELLILLTITKVYKWSQISTYFIQESDTRNVFWYAVGNARTPAPHPELLNVNTVIGSGGSVFTPATSNKRCEKVFQSTQVSRNLIMYQVRFSQVAKEQLTMEVMDSNQGLAPSELRTGLKNTYNEISNVKSSNQYFAWLSMPSVSYEVRTQQLIDAVNRSAAQGYHGALNNHSSSGKPPRGYPNKR